MTPEAITSDYVTRLNVSAVEVARECRKQLFANLGQPVPDETASAIDVWTEAVEGLFELCNRGIAAMERNGELLTIPWRRLANQLQQQITQQPVPDSQPEITCRLWEAAVRLAVNCILAEDDHELQEALSHDFRGWILGEEPLMREEDSDDDRD